MQQTRRWMALAMVAWAFGAAVLTASPAAADVNCSDLGPRSAAQTYFEGRTSDLDHLDGDGDGQACEASSAHAGGTWTLILLGVLFAAGLARYATFATDEKEKSASEPAPLEPVSVGAPVIVEQAAVGVAPAPVKRRLRLVTVAVDGSVTELARALRMVKYVDRMRVLEEHAVAHGSSPRDVLDALARTTSDLELQGWALAGYDPPWTVRVMRCSCVEGLRNFQLRTADDGTRYWACASCHQPVRVTP